MKKFFPISTLVVLAVVLFAGAEKARAQTDTLKKAVENVKQSVDTLVTARDENASSDLGLRLEAFKKVISLSISEAKDLKVKLVLTDESNKGIKEWRDSVFIRLNAILDYLSKEQELVISGRLKDVSGVKDEAQAFKEWRDSSYTPLALEIESFFIVKKSGEVIKTASNRVVKINKDIVKLQKLNPKTAINLKVLLKKAEGSIDSGAKLQKESEGAFEVKYVRPVLEAMTTSTDGGLGATSTDELAMTTEATKNDEKVESSAKAGEPVSEEVSIKDLVRASFAKVREAYQVFIEMSNLVREVL